MVQIKFVSFFESYFGLIGAQSFFLLSKVSIKPTSCNKGEKGKIEKRKEKKRKEKKRKEKKRKEKKRKEKKETCDL